MERASAGNVLMLRLDHDEDILESMSKAVALEKSTLMLVLGIGMIHDFEIGYFDRGRYIRKKFQEPHELLSMQGSVSVEGEPRVHVHLTVADRDHKAFGGHLMAGRAWMSNEIGFLRLEGHRSARILDPEKKVGVLRIG
jgi:hypothetical protein